MVSKNNPRYQEARKYLIKVILTEKSGLEERFPREDIPGLLANISDEGLIFLDENIMNIPEHRLPTYLKQMQQDQDTEDKNSPKSQNPADYHLTDPQYGVHQTASLTDSVVDKIVKDLKTNKSPGPQAFCGRDSIQSMPCRRGYDPSFKG